MYSGFITRKRVIKKIGTHQRFNSGAYRLISGFTRPGSFPELKKILHFEGLNGPDGLKIKSPGKDDPNHSYDPYSGEGEVIEQIQNHYAGLVRALRHKDMVRSAFEASWLAHFVTDGMCPAHHIIYHKEIDHLRPNPSVKSRWHKHVIKGDGLKDSIKRNWLVWGRGGIITNHLNFEMGMASMMLTKKGPESLTWDKVNSAWRLGACEFFKVEATKIANLKIYDSFCSQGWTAEIAKAVRRHVIPATAEALATIWILAYLEAELAEVSEGVTREALLSLATS